MQLYKYTTVQLYMIIYSFNHSFQRYANASDTYLDIDTKL